MDGQLLELAPTFTGNDIYDHHDAMLGTLPVQNQVFQSGWQPEYTAPISRLELLVFSRKVSHAYQGHPSEGRGKISVNTDPRRLGTDGAWHGVGISLRRVRVSEALRHLLGLEPYVLHFSPIKQF